MITESTIVNGALFLCDRMIASPFMDAKILMEDKSCMM